MQKSTKILLSSAAAVLVLAGTIGAGSASEGKKNYPHGGYSYKSHGGSEMKLKLFEKFDADKNGSITTIEIDSVRKSELAKYDSNNDGKINLGEFEALWLNLMRESMVDHFQRLDSDGDAQVTDAEIAKPLKRLMTHLDRNEDGMLTKDEIQRKRHSWMSKFRGHGERDDDDDDKKSN